jgi:N-acetylglutamate synthase-like GNAT family acetyltransferase
MKIKIRFAHMNGRAQLIELQRRASLANENDREALLAHPEAVDLPVVQIEAGDVLVAEIDGKCLGFSSIYIRDDGNGELDGLFVEPNQWNGGLGRKLVETAARRALDHGAQKLHVIGNPHAEGFYKKVGFVQTGDFQTAFGPGLLMEMNLI